MNGRRKPNIRDAACENWKNAFLRCALVVGTYDNRCENVFKTGKNLIIFFFLFFYHLFHSRREICMKLPSKPVFSNCIPSGCLSKPFHAKGAPIKHFSAKFAPMLVRNLLLSADPIDISRHNSIIAFSKTELILSPTCTSTKKIVGCLATQKICIFVDNEGKKHRLKSNTIPSIHGMFVAWRLNTVATLLRRCIGVYCVGALLSFFKLVLHESNSLA